MSAMKAQADETGHIDATCTNPDCYGCMFCAGGLWACTMCDGLEGSMPSTCPGERMDKATIDAVYAGRLDYRDGAWAEGAASRFAPFSVQRGSSCDVSTTGPASSSTTEISLSEETQP